METLRSNMVKDSMSIELSTVLDVAVMRVLMRSSDDDDDVVVVAVPSKEKIGWRCLPLFFVSLVSPYTL